MLCQIPTRHIVIPQPPPCPGLTLALSLQEGLSCSACTLQWYWSSGNSCVYDGDYFDYYRGIEKGLNRSHVWSFPPTRLSLWGVVWWPYSLFCMNRYAWKLLEKAAIPSFQKRPTNLNISQYTINAGQEPYLFFFSSMEKTWENWGQRWNPTTNCCFTSASCRWTDEQSFFFTSKDLYESWPAHGWM